MSRLQNIRAWSWIKQYFAAPIYEDDDTAQLARIFNSAIILALIVVIFFSPFLWLLSVPNTSFSIMNTVFLTLIFLGVHYLLRQGHFHLARNVLAFLLYVYITAIVFMTGGIFSPVYGSYPPLIVIASLLLARRMAFGIAGLLILTTIGIVVADNQGLIPPPIIPPSLAYNSIVQIINLTVLALFVALATNRLRVALRNTRRSQRALVKRNQELALLNNTASMFSATLELDQVLNVVLEEVKQMLGTVACSVWLVDVKTRELVCQQVTDPHGEIVRGWRLSPGTGLVGWVAQHGEILNIPDVLKDHRHYKGVDQQTQLPLRSILSIPLKARGKVIGVLQAVDTTQDHFADVNTQLLEALAGQAAIAIENARLYKADHRQAEQLEALRQVSQDLTILRNLDVLLYQICSRAIQLTAAQVGVTLLHRPDREVLEVVVAAGDTRIQPGSTVKRGQGMAGLVWETEKLVMVDDYEIWEPGLPNEPKLTGSAISVPIRWGDQFLGVLTVANRATSYFTTNDADLLLQFAAQAAIAIHNASLYESAQQEIADRKQAEQQIQVALKEKEILFKEVHHRVKNNLQVISSLLDLQSNYIESEDVQQLFRESQSRVRSMSLVHELLYQTEDLTRIDFGRYIRELIDNLIGSYGIRSSIQIETDLENLYFELDFAIPCGLIINELVSNALKYAFPLDEPGKVYIKLQEKEGGQIALIVEDNGVGLPENIDMQNTDTLGLQLVTILTEQLRGEIRHDPQAGARFTIIFNRTRD